MATNGSVNIVPNGYTNVASAGITDPQNAYDTGGSNYASIRCTLGSGKATTVDFLINASAIPEGAVVVSTSCYVRIQSPNSLFYKYLASETLSVYCGDTLKGTVTVESSSSSSAQTVTIDCGLLTLEELNNCKIRYYAKRGTSLTADTAETKFYGAYIYVKYAIPDIIPIVGSVNINGVSTPINRKGNVVNINGVVTPIQQSWAYVNGVWVPTYVYEELVPTVWKKYYANKVEDRIEYYLSGAGYTQTYWYDFEFVKQYGYDYDEHYNHPYTEFNDTGWFDGSKLYADASIDKNTGIVSFTNKVFDSLPSFLELKDYHFSTVGTDVYTHLYLLRSGGSPDNVTVKEGGLGYELTFSTQYYIENAFDWDFHDDAFSLETRELRKGITTLYKWVCGDYIEDVSSMDSAEYPSNGRSGDYWYIKQ